MCYIGKYIKKTIEEQKRREKKEKNKKTLKYNKIKKNKDIQSIMSSGFFLSVDVENKILKSLNYFAPNKRSNNLNKIAENINAKISTDTPEDAFNVELLHYATLNSDYTAKLNFDDTIILLCRFNEITKDKRNYKTKKNMTQDEINLFYTKCDNLLGVSRLFPTSTKNTFIFFLPQDNVNLIKYI